VEKVKDQRFGNGKICVIFIRVIKCKKLIKPIVIKIFGQGDQNQNHHKNNGDPVL
jgi:hypothetical protein